MGREARRRSRDWARRLVFCLCALCALCGFSSVLRADEFSQVSRYSVRLYPQGTVVVETRIGDVNVEGWDEPRVEIEAEKMVRAGSEAKARKRFEQIRIELDSNDEEVRLRTLYPPRRPWRLFRGATKLSVNLQIRMPREASLYITCVDGDLRIRGLAGNQEVRLNYGDVEITVPSLWRLRSLDARAWLGYVQSNLHPLDEGSAGFGRRVSFRNPQGEQEILVRVRFGGVTVSSDGD